MKLDLGCGPHKAEGCIGVDVRKFDGVDMVCDLASVPWPFDDSSVDEVRASHILEHLPDILGTMDELYRILKPGGIATIDVPSTNGPGAFQDPTHKSFWNLNTFLYLDRRHELGAMYNCNRWIVRNLYEYNLPGIAAFGPYVHAVLEKPNAGE